MADTIRLEPNPANKCFGCGGDNAGGMKLTFEQDNANRKIVGRFVLGERYQGGAGFALRSTAEMTSIMETRSNDRRASMDHLDGASFSFEHAESQRSISFPQVSGYAHVSFLLLPYFEPCAPKALRSRRHRGFSSEA